MSEPHGEGPPGEGARPGEVSGRGGEGEAATPGSQKRIALSTLSPHTSFMWMCRVSGLGVFTDGRGGVAEVLRKDYLPPLLRLSLRL